MRRTALFLFALTAAHGAEPKLKLNYLQAAPGDFVLSGKWASQRIVVTGKASDGTLHDLTGQARFQSSNAKIATVNPGGLVTSVADGEANIEIKAAGKKQKLHVTVKDSRVQRAAFLTEVWPLLGKLGCSTAACHGAARGKGGLRLSLFGGDPGADFEALTKAAGGRRINRADPPDSLLYLKATGRLDHPGTLPAPRESGILLAWLKAGAPWAAGDNAHITALNLYPDDRVFRKGDAQHLLVTAVFSDGQVRDVSNDAAYHASDPRIASVTPDGLVKAEASGVAAIVVTYQRQSTVLRLAIPYPGPKPFPELAANNRVDELVYAKLKAMGVPPSPLASDEVFLRRVYLDVIGLLPTAEEARAFLAKPDRARLIDSLLARDEFNDFWSLKWGDLLRIKSEYPVRVWPKAVAVYYQWVHDSLAANKPYDQFVRELLTSTGSNFRVGPANFVRAVPAKDARTLGETAALVFMGERIGCARCHAHPLESWSLDDDLALGAFFARVNYKGTQEWKEEIVYPDFRQSLRDPRTRTVVEARLPGAAAPSKIGAEEDPRGQFAEWLTAPGNPYFARNIANRVWFWLLGRGIVNEPDDVRPTNPPVNPELLAYLEGELASHRFDLRHLYRLILNSRTYQLSSEPNQWNAGDAALFSHYPVKRLAAEQMLDAISQFTETNERFRSIIPEPYSNWPATYRATQISDGNTECSFLDLFGRPPRDTPYEQERNNDPTLKQALYFLNSEQLEGKVSGSPHLKRVLAKPDAEVVDDIYLSSVSRFPTPDEKKRLVEYLGARKSARAQAVQDVAWALLNAKEFEFNH
uniref:BIG2 domain-containing protein n=1 Tax=Solibacter usitatus (strain Ellin6076) TaxID=234267 RepID=Q020D5_SOLUE